MLAKYEDACQVSEEYRQGYIAGLMMDTKSTSGKSVEFHRGYYMAMIDVIDLEPESCC